MSGDIWTRLIELYPIKGKLEFWMPEFLGDVYRVYFRAENPYYEWTVKGATKERAQAKAMEMLLRMK